MPVNSPVLYTDFKNGASVPVFDVFARGEDKLFMQIGRLPD